MSLLVCWLLSYLDGERGKKRKEKVNIWEKDDGDDDSDWSVIGRTMMIIVRILSLSMSSLMSSSERECERMCALKSSIE